MKSAILSALALVPALAGLLSAAEPPDVPARALGEIPPLPSRTAATPAKKSSGKPIGLTIRVYEMDTAKLQDSIDFRPQKEDRKTVNDQLEEMRKLGIVKVVAEPHLVTMDGRPAKMLSGGEVPVLSPAAKNTVAIDFIPFGTRVDMTPKRVGKDRYQIRINAEFTRPSAHGLALDGPKDAANPVILGRSIRTVATLGPKDIVVLNDSEAREEDEPRKVTFMTIELADLGVEAALLQFDEPGEGPPAEGAIEVPRRNVNEFPKDTPPPSRASRDSFGVESPVETGTNRAAPGREETADLPATLAAKIPQNSFFLKPGKTQLELVRGTWKSFTIPSKDFAYGSSLLVESPDQGAISISGRNLTAQFDGPAKTESFEAGQNGEKYAADIWTVRAQRPGVATIRLIDDDDQSYEVEITVVGDTRHFDRMVKRFHPNARVEAIELTEQSVVITGEASSQDATAIQEIAQQLYPQVLLRLKNQPAQDQLQEGDVGDTAFDYGRTLQPATVTPGELASDTGAQTFPSEIGAAIAEPETTPADDPDLSTAIGDGVPARSSETVPIPDGGTTLDLETGSTSVEGNFENGASAPGPEPFTEATANEIVAYRETSQPPTPTTQIRFLNTGFISMRTPHPSSGELLQVPMWDPWSTWKTINGQSQQVRYNTHRENVAQGSRTLFQFRTTEFRNDVWVNGLLLTAVGNAKTRYFLQHFPVDLLVENHEVIAAAKGSLVTRIVVMKEDRPPVRTEEGETTEPRFTFTGAKSFEEAVEQGRRRGELIAVLVLGPESVLENGVARNRFRLPANQVIGGSGDQFEPDTPLSDPYRGKDPSGKVGFDDPGQFEGTATADSEESHWVARTDGSVSIEMRQLRQEVHSLRQQLAKLVEVLSREHAPKTEEEIPDRVVPVPPRTVPIPIGTDSGFDRGETLRDSASETLPPPELDDGVGPRGSTESDDSPAPPAGFDPFDSEPPPLRKREDKSKPEPGPITSIEETKPTRELESPFASEATPVPNASGDSDSDATIEPPLPDDSTAAEPNPAEIPELATE